MSNSSPVPDNIWSLSTHHLGRTVHVYDRLDSTNTLALTLAQDPDRHGLVLLAREQTAGRGQYGRSWQAPVGSSVLMTVLLFPLAKLRRPALLTAWAAVSVCATARSLANLDTTIKWPNDVLAHGKKVCGILIEQRTTGRQDFPLAAAVGIGLNLIQTARMFEAAELPQAASIRSLTGIVPEHDVAAQELIRQLDHHYHLLVEDNLQSLEAEWKARLGLIGKQVVLEDAGHPRRGQLLDVSFDGVTLAAESGETMMIPPEAIRHLYEDSGAS